MTKISELTDTKFDGVNHPYVPPKQLKISPVKLHRDAADDFDPVTFEVIRHDLWNVNEEHGATIQRISGSPVAMYALDLNPLDPHRGCRVRLFRAVHAVHVRRHRHAGEVDPREPQRQSRHPRRRHVPRQRSLGRRRASDGRDADLPRVLGGRALLLGDQLPAPIRHRRHHAAAASAPRRADAFDEGILIPPVKIVENNEIRRDIEEHLSALVAQARAGGARFPRADRRQHGGARAHSAAHPPLWRATPSRA